MGDGKGAGGCGGGSTQPGHPVGSGTSPCEERGWALLVSGLGGLWLKIGVRCGVGALESHRIGFPGGFLWPKRSSQRCAIR